MASNYVNIPAYGSPSWRDPVVLTSQLPVNGNSVGDVRVAEDTNTIYIWNGVSWIAVATPGAAIAIDGLIGDVTATGPGVVVATLSSTGVTPGSYGSASQVGAFTVDAKGRLSAASNVSIQISEAQVTNLVADLAGKQPVGNYITALTGDVTASGPGSAAATLSSTGVVAGSYTLASITVDAKGRLSVASSGTVNLTTQVTGILPIANGGTNNSSAYTSGSVIFSDGTKLTQDNANFFWNDTNFSLGIGMNTPASNAFIDGVNSSGATKRIQITGYANSVGFRGRYANGTLGSPTAAVNTNVLAFLSAQGYGATGFPAASTALINMTAAATFTDSSMPTDVNILTTPVGSITAVQTALFSNTGATTLGAVGNTGQHLFNGGVRYTSKTITANYSVDATATDYTILCNAAGAITVTLPTPTSGRRLEIKDISGAATANNITIARHAAETIEGIAASYLIQISYGTIILHSDGTNWWIVG